MSKSFAIAGKGGTGKSTIAALIVLELLEQGKTPILAVDADPDANLGLLLGVEVRKTIGDLREDVLQEIKNFPAGMSKAEYIEAGLHQIIEEQEGFDLITMGRGEGSGCYCYLNILIRKFSEELYPCYNWIVMDNEAGLEHISRRTTSNIDNLLIVVTENPVSVSTAKSIKNITETIKTGIENRYIVTNMVSEERKSEVINRIKDLDMEYIGNIPKDREIEKAIFQGRPIGTISSLSPARKSIKNILKKITIAETYNLKK